MILGPTGLMVRVHVQTVAARGGYRALEDKVEDERVRVRKCKLLWKALTKNTVRGDMISTMLCSC